MQFDHIFLNASKSSGRLRLAASGLGWKASGPTQKPYTVAATDLRRAVWQRAARGYELKLFLKSGSCIALDGFTNDDFHAIRDTLRTNYNVTVERKECPVKGWNWGQTTVTGDEIVFSVENEPSFEIPSSQVSNVNMVNKHEISLEIEPSNAIGDMANGLGAAVQELGYVDEVVEMRLYVPGEVEDEGDDSEEDTKPDKNLDIIDDEAEEERPLAASVLYDRIREHAEVQETAGENICSFAEIMFLTPRGRYELDMYKDSFRLRGASYDYKVSYSQVTHMFLLPRPDEIHTVLVIGVDPPLRQGQTRYPFLVAQFVTKEAIELELNVSDDEYEKEYKGKLERTYDAPEHEVISQVLRGFTNIRITRPGIFQSAQKSSLIKCSLKASEGHLYPLDRSLVFLMKPVLFIPHKNIATIVVSRVSASISASRTFDLKIEMRDRSSYQFLNVNKDEQNGIEEYFASKDIKIHNEIDEENAAVQAAMDDVMSDEDDDDDDDDDDIPIRSEDEDEDESVDEDFEMDDDDDDGSPSSSSAEEDDADVAAAGSDDGNDDAEHPSKRVKS